MTGACVFCKSTGNLNRRVFGAGIEVDVCDKCMQLGQQAMAVAHTLKPLQPHLERLVSGLLSRALKK